MRETLLLLLLLPLLSMCRPLSLKGKIINEKGEPLSGATITVKPALSNIDPKSPPSSVICHLSSNSLGEFTIPALHLADTLLISAAGYQPQTKVINQSLSLHASYRVMLRHCAGLYEAKKIAAPGTTVPATGGHPQPLAVGDFLPPQVLASVRSAGWARGTAIGGKNQWVLLVFWSAACQGSVALLPRLNSLQNEFGNRVLMLPVCAESAAQATRSLGARSAALQSQLITGDTLLKKYFPHVMVPHVVWISPQGRVEAITESWHLTTANLRAALRGQALNLPLKKDLLKVSPENIFLETDSTTRFSAVLTGYSAGLPSSVHFITDSARAQYRVLALNQTIRSLLDLAFPGLSVLPQNRLLVHPSLAAAFTPPPPGTDPTAALFCYQLSIPLVQKEQAEAGMQNDLTLFFGLTAGWQQQQRDCWVLTRFDTTALLTTAGGRPAHNLTGPGAKWMRNLRLSVLLTYLNHGPLPVLDNTGFTGRVDLRLNNDLSNTAALNKALATYGLVLQKEKKTVRVMVINPFANTGIHAKTKQQ